MSPNKSNDKHIKVKNYIIRRSSILLLARISIVLFTYVMISYVLTLFPTIFGLDFLTGITIVAQLSLAIVTLVSIVLLNLGWRNEYYEVQKSGIIHHKGVFYNRERDYSCSNIETITLKQSFMGKLLHYGTILLYDPALRQNIILYNIGSPNKHLEVLKRTYLHLQRDKGRTTILQQT